MNKVNILYGAVKRLLIAEEYLRQVGLSHLAERVQTVITEARGGLPPTVLAVDDRPETLSPGILAALSAVKTDRQFLTPTEYAALAGADITEVEVMAYFTSRRYVALRRDWVRRAGLIRRRAGTIRPAFAGYHQLLGYLGRRAAADDFGLTPLSIVANMTGADVAHIRAYLTEERYRATRGQWGLLDDQLGGV